MEASRTSLEQIEQLLNDSAFQKKLARIAVQKGESLVQVNTEAEACLNELYAEQRAGDNFLFVEIVQYLLGRGYDKMIDIDPEQIKALARLMRRHPVAFVLTHKTYLDLLVLALVLARHGLPLPFMFAGINLDFWGLGQWVRRNGVIFIRRSFKDNPVYKATLRHYISWLLKHQSHFMWAIEGTRSRTGKLVWPQMGILKYIMESDQDAGSQVKYVPVSIVYDLIPDVEEMTREGRGKSKKPESLSWLMDYWRQLGNNDLGRISLRIGAPADLPVNIPIPEEEDLPGAQVSKLAFDLVHRINQTTPVTTTSLVCTALLSKFSLSKRALESDVADLMALVERHKADALTDRGRPIGESVQYALHLLLQAGIFMQQGEGLNSRFMVRRESYLQATYYDNMAVHHLYRRAFIELALLKITSLPVHERRVAFWQEIMSLRDLFKFEFFYSGKARFTDEVEADMTFMHSDWERMLFVEDADILDWMSRQKILIAPVLLVNYVEAYRVVAQGLQTWDATEHFTEERFVQFCLFLGEEMHWQGLIRRLEAVSKPFLQNGVRLAANLDLIPTATQPKRGELQQFIGFIEEVRERVQQLQGLTLIQPAVPLPEVPVERDIVPGSRLEAITRDILEGEKGAHIGAFFDLDRTLIKGFSAKEFVTARLKSGRFTSQEILSQFAGVLSYATGNGNFAAMAALSARGVKGIPEQVFMELGEEVYQKELAQAIYPESRALVSAHLAMGHTVAIVSAATPYQVEPVARDLGVSHVMCTRMEVKKGKFTGKIIEPACWGEGKAEAGRQLAETHGLHLSDAYFYTDSISDLPLLELVGRPRPVNPDTQLATKAFQNDWPVFRFSTEHTSTVEQIARTALTSGMFVPAVMTGIFKGLTHGSWTEGVESMFAGLGDLGTAMAGIRLAVKGEEHLWSHRPAVFILNHQSYVDFLIAAKLIRKQARGVAKHELRKMPVIGQMLQAADTIFLDRTDREKSIEALKPAVDSLKKGVSVIIFPEGTRSYDKTLGSFKKGAFHLAMQAGAPIVPIILKNAHDAMPRGTNLLRPTMVEVVVMPPILTETWSRDHLDEHIAEVRQLFLDELGQ